MSAPGESVAVEPAAPAATAAARGTWIEGLLASLGDRLNPILVKEARQALKSRQFLITFTLVLVCGWIWSILGLGFGPEVSYTPSGVRMFIGYYLILAFPLVVIVPFGAFRSLTVEQEDRTYELMSITALSPRQIITGKLGCAVAQMLIYLSAISPCLAFTYLLRGIDVVAIALGIVYVVMVSLGLSMIGLTIGALTNDRHWQVLATIAMIVGLLLAFWGSSMLLADVISQGFPVDDPEFWIAMAAAATAYGSYFALFFYTAVARISFASDNRSTRLRVVMFLQHVLLSGWVALALVFDPGDTGLLYTYLAGMLVHWVVMGAFMTGESPALSLRVRRSLPQSMLGRMLFTWFNPGPATGYVFAVCGGIGALIVVALGASFTRLLLPLSNVAWRGQGPQGALIFGVLGVSYLVIYLGVGLLVVRGLRRLGQSGIPLTVLLHILLVMLGCGLPVVLDMAFSNASNVSYSSLQMFNFVWTLEKMTGLPPPETPMLLTALPGIALAVFLLNLPGILREVEYVRIAKPARVAEEDAEVAAQLHPPEFVQVSPWDIELRP